MALPSTVPLPAPVQSLLWIRDSTKFMQVCRRLYGTAFTVELMSFSISLFSDPDSIRTIFASKATDMHAGEINRILRSVVGSSSVLLLDDEEHMRHRKLLLPSFHGERMRLYGETMAELTRAVMATRSEERKIVVHEAAQEITLQIILRTVFGAEGARLTELVRQINHMNSAADSRVSFALMLFLSRNPQLETKQPWSWLLRTRDDTDRLLYEQIAQRRSEAGKVARTDVLAMLMEARDDEGEPMSDRELRDELITALLAGHETTATALAWSFERILLHPPVYQRLRDEIDAAGGMNAQPEKLASLPYLDATVKEVLRSRPVVPAVGRVLQRPMRIGGYDFPKGAIVGACIYLAHRDPDLYPEPEQFRPERFLGVATDPVSWLPFGGGIRRCIGAQFALFEMKIVLATILAAYDCDLAQKLPARIARRGVTLWPKGGTPIRIKRRLPLTAAAR